MGDQRFSDIVPGTGVSRPIRVLHLEDDPRDADLIHRRLRAEGLPCEIVWVNGRQAFESRLDQQQFDLVLTDYSLPDYDAIAALAQARAKQPNAPVIVVSGTLGEDEAVECLKAGATDYVLKQRPQRLGAAVNRALREAEQHQKRRQAEAALRESEEQFRSAMEFSAIGMALVAPDGRWLKVNRALCQMTGYGEEELLVRDFQSITHPDDLENDLEQVRRMLASEIESYQLEKRYVRKDGGFVWILLGVSLLRHPNGQPRHFISQIQDITLRKEQEARIVRLNRVYAVLSGINTAIVRIRERQSLFDEACRIVVEHGRFRMAWIGMLDAGTLDITPVAWAGFEDGFLRECRLSAREDIVEGRGMAGQAIRSGRPVVVNDVANDHPALYRTEALVRGYRASLVLPLTVEGKPVGVLALNASEPGFFDTDELRLLTELAGDVSFALDHIQKEERLNYLAYYDELTGLPNRTLFYDRTEQILNAAKRSDGLSAAVVMLDLERFSTINETFGRHTGDAVLKQIAQRLSSGRVGQEHVARISGDIFAAVLRDVRNDADVTRFLGKRVTELLQQPLTVQDQELRLTAKAGVALFPADGADADTLFHNAEAALKKAKLTGDKYQFYTPELNSRVAERLTLENKLRRALERRELALHYQPKIALETGRVSGLEALMRWNDPDSGFVPPARFIPLMEETGLILEAGRWALEQAAADYQKWLQEGLAAPRIAVNVSAVQLRQKDFVEMLHEVISAFAGSRRHDGCGLDLEITESLVMQDIAMTVEKLRTVRQMGIGIALDDFGTGYSSLSYIARLPVTALKIDRAFIAKMTSSPVDLGIVTTIISLAHSMKIKVIAEGVETEEQSGLLKRLGCDEMQGHLYSPAVPAEKIVTMLQGN